MAVKLDIVIWVAMVVIGESEVVFDEYCIVPNGYALAITAV